MGKPVEQSKGKRNYGSNIIVLSLLAVTALTTIFGVFQLRLKNDYRNRLADSYAESLYSAASYASDMKNTLTKLLAVRTPEQAAPLYASLWRQASSAKENLSRLDSESAGDALTYLSQVSDFAYSMMTKSISGTMPEESDYERLLEVRGIAANLASEMASVSQRLSVGEVIDFQKQGGASGGENSLSGAIKGSLTAFAGKLQAQSDAGKTQVASGNESEITAAAGAEIIGQMFGTETPLNITLISETPAGAAESMPVYSYKISRGKEKSPAFYADITKNGGLPLWILNAEAYRGGGSQLPIDEILRHAADFLNNCGFPAMRSGGCEISDDCVTVVFSPLQDGVIIYPAAVKVKLSADSGEVLGLAAHGYAENSGYRELNEPLLSANDALGLVNPYFVLDTISQAIISTDSGGEAFCYELLGSVGETKMLVYINCMTAAMEKICEVRENAYGVLTD